jgi:HAD superfamily hydrolase (TIGR01509 family)
MTLQLIIFDFDGVVADSETVACDVLARLVTELGHPMSLDESLDRFMGKRIGDVASTVEQLVGHPLPGFAEDLQRRTLEAFRTELHEVPGVTPFLTKHRAINRCIASSSAPERIRFCINALHLSEYLGQWIFSAEEVKRGKPFPDIFLYAAEGMHIDPKDIVVIEDSPGGVEAAVAAGMRVIGLLAASHLRPGHEAKLRAKGATFIAHSYDDITALLPQL